MKKNFREKYKGLQREEELAFKAEFQEIKKAAQGGLFFKNLETNIIYMLHFDQLL